jgi:predicted GTPase
MAKKKARIDFKGPSALDLGVVVSTPEKEVQDPKAEILANETKYNTDNIKSVTDKGNSKSIVTEKENVSPEKEGKKEVEKKQKEIEMPRVEAVATGAGKNSVSVALLNENITVTTASPVTPSPRRESVYRKMIRDYLNRALGDNESVVIKLLDMKNNLEITDKTLYGHLKVLRQTEFEIKKLRYGTEVKRRK